MKSFETDLGIPVCEVDGDLFERSRLARAGPLACSSRRFYSSDRARVGAPPALLIVAGPALAQTPGGNLFGGNDQQFSSGFGRQSGGGGTCYSYSASEAWDGEAATS